MQIEEIADTRMVAAAPGVHAQSPLRVVRRLDDPSGFRSLETHEQVEFPYEFIAEVEVVEGRYEIVQLLFRGGQNPIGTGWLAKTPIADIRLYALNYTNIEVQDQDGQKREIYANKFIDTWCEEARGGSPASDLRSLAIVYRVIRLGWRNPVARLAGLLGVHHDTVRRWIVSAVKSGHLEAWERG
ncbi:hypothetical protein [Leucobacter chromiiresistens]|uniref:Uncharacterized protein n=1 Tax=Leucobacter chromiiresistens TaxID=1079994 RepID=A0A1H0Y8K3_9MICO|nr:hypothetical protein [Leucobacter chromiiresistens]SDQ11442.1 hypothetical protein SAMN04488565_0626 [Leucobacter chromiiresistens]